MTLSVAVPKLVQGDTAIHVMDSGGQGTLAVEAAGATGVDGTRVHLILLEQTQHAQGLRNTGLTRTSCT